jgi:hypothetical protein
MGDTQRMWDNTDACMACATHTCSSDTHTLTHTHIGCERGPGACADAANNEGLVQGLHGVPLSSPPPFPLSTTNSFQAHARQGDTTHDQPVQRLRCVPRGAPSVGQDGHQRRAVDPYSQDSRAAAHYSIDALTLRRSCAGLGGGDLGWAFNAGPFGSDWSTQGRQSLKCDVYETPVRALAPATSLHAHAACAQLCAVFARTRGWVGTKSKGRESEVHLPASSSSHTILFASPSSERVQVPGGRAGSQQGGLGH